MSGWKYQVTNSLLDIFFILKGVIAETLGADSNDHVFTLMEGVGDTGKSAGNSGNCEDLVGEEEGDRTVASVEDQLRKEMTVYEVCVYLICMTIIDLAVKVHCS